MEPPWQPQVQQAPGQRGFALIVVMMILVVVSGLGVGATRMALMGERGARNDRDMQVAWQAAEAALMDAEFDIRGPLPSTRRTLFGAGGDPPEVASFPASGCGSSGQTLGLCAVADEAQAPPDGKRAWLKVDFLADGKNATTAPYGAFTGRTYLAGSGVQPARAPRYVIEPLLDHGQNADTSSPDQRYAYRITAIGFGPRTDIQAVLQMVLRP